LLTEIPRVRQHSDADHRRWFVDDRMELTAWQDAHGDVVAFQLSYRIGGSERVLSWRRCGGLTHDAVDDGELPVGRHKQSPILVPDGAVPWQRLRSAFAERASAIDPVVAETVTMALASGDEADESG
jgi:hypothetical protein